MAEYKFIVAQAFIWMYNDLFGFIISNTEMPEV